MYLVPHVPCTLSALAPYVLSCLACFMPYVLSFPTCLVPYVLSCLTCLVPQGPLTMRALVPHMLRVLLAPVFHVPRASRASWPMWLSVSRFKSPFSLRTLLFRTLLTLCSNITFSTFAFPSLMLLTFCSFASCDFFGKFTKVKTNIVFQYYFEVMISLYQQYDIFNYLKPNTNTLHMKLQIIFAQVKVNLKLSIVIIKSYSHRINEIAGNLSN